MVFIVIRNEGKKLVLIGSFGSKKCLVEDRHFFEPGGGSLEYNVGKLSWASHLGE
jgi:hypothetical protein